jgi:TetR/AcrR family transcriptional regulator
MARTRAADYDDKRRAILAAATALFAEHGYDRSSISDVAKACGVSKALLYHYYGSKEVLLYDIIEHHLDRLLVAIEAADTPGLAPRARLEAFAVALLVAYRDANHEHKIQINELPKLPEPQQETLKALERELVARFAGAVAAVRPELVGNGLLKPVTMSLFGMLNWHYLWFRPKGQLSREDYGRLAVTLLLDGVNGAEVFARNGVVSRPALRTPSAAQSESNC